MATLPDIDTGVCGPIGWWNALDHGASYLDPDDLLSYSGVGSYTAYDNGIEGDLSRKAGLKWRAKTDGWIVVYFDTSDATVREYDFIDNFEGPNIGLTNTAISQEINGLRQEAENSGDMTFNHSDVGIYDYQHSGLTRYETYKVRKKGSGGKAHFAYSTQAQKPPALWVAAYCNDTQVSFEGSVVQNGTGRGQLEAVSNGLIPNPATFYTAKLQYFNYSDEVAEVGLLSLHTA